MDLLTYVNSGRGLRQRLAAELRVPPILISQWALRRRPIPIERCTAIERATGWQVTRRDLRPNDWADIWPELKGAEHA
ncbi:transcriptional regulator [Allopusillimonas ginsengisoli]|uniref:transcriptional regulator n=1 Tax=Allopusillimonas ginsengisoli TaxID=453575 RepID=UPI001020820D|nr:YdaS family helix-turn-helix protein [Allopusillimonas ginsengisoli]TEA79815.1 hypothetical protein ERE07_02415 [Allopusillimonas ginsengisoli]